MKDWILNMLGKIPRSIFILVAFTLLGASAYLTANLVFGWTEVDFYQWGTWVAPVLLWGLTVGSFWYLFLRGKDLKLGD